MKKLLVLLVPLTLVLSACSSLVSEASSSPAEAAAAQSKRQISNTGVVVSGGDVFGKRLVDAYLPNYQYFVNDAVMYGSKADIRQFRRSTDPMPTELNAALSMLKIKVGASVELPTGTAKLLNKHLASHGPRFLQVSATLRDSYSGRKTHGVIEYKVVGGAISQISVSKSLLPTGPSQEICFYYPANCLTHLRLNYTAATVKATMDSARRRFEHKWLRKAQTGNFEALLTATQNTYAALPSWTTVSTDNKQGSIYDSKTKRGVSWDQYDMAVKFASATAGLGPDLGLVSSTLFDNTDGGSNFFYSGITADSTKSTFTVTNQDGSPAVIFRVRNNRLKSISNYVITKYTVHVNGKVNRNLLDRKLASAQ